MISIDAAKHSPRGVGRDVIVVGGSAGAVDALRTMLAGLPADLDAVVLVVVHISAGSPARLAEILQRGCALPVGWATGDEPLETRRVYVAPPDRHLVVAPERVLLTLAARENHSRPAIDPLFRSAAIAYGPRVIGVVVSGRLDDGTAGLWAVKERGGIAVVQDPDDAAYADMPCNALVYTTADHIVTAADMGPLLGRLVGESAPTSVGTAPRELEMRMQIATVANALAQGVLTLRPPTPYACPESHAVLAHVAREARERADLIRQAVLRHQALSLESIRVSTLELERGDRRREAVSASSPASSP